VIWIERNDVVLTRGLSFSKNSSFIWKGFLDYGNVDWGRCLDKIRKSPNIELLHIVFSLVIKCGVSIRFYLF
jgi:hypothetical protein